MRTHVERDFHSGVQPAFLSNGMIGMRRGPHPLVPADVSLSGYVGTHPSLAMEAAARTPDPLVVDLCVNGYPASSRADHVTVEQQRYDFSSGELESRFAYSVDGVSTRVTVLTFISRTSPTVALQRVDIDVSADCDLRVTAALETTAAPGELVRRTTPSRNLDGAILWIAAGQRSQCGVAMAAHLESDDLERVKRDDYGHERGSIRKHFYLRAKKGRRYRVVQYASLVPGVLHSEPDWQAARMVGLAQWHGFDSLREQNRAAWSDLWRGRPVVVGASEEWQDVIDAAHFYLHSSIHPSSPFSIAPFGLSDRDAYKGHVFWDAESFMYIPTLLISPRSARAMVRYRSDRLDAARRNAAIHGQSGAMFPWQSGLHGDEVTEINAGFDGGAAELHVSMDVALAFVLYARSLTDVREIEAFVWPVVRDVADWICTRAERTNRGFEIRHVVGVDESLHDVDNNAFTNISARLVLHHATRLAHLLSQAVPKAWGEVGEQLLIPMNEDGLAILPHEGFRDLGGKCHPGTLMAYYPYGFSMNETVDEATLRYYLDRADSYRGGAMMNAGLGVFAAWLGDRGLARELFDRGNLPYISRSFLQFTEIPADAIAASAAVDKSRWLKTPFVTHAGGLLGALLHGLPRLDLFAEEPSEVASLPAVLPEGWESIHVERLWVHGAPVRLTAANGRPTELEPCDE